MRALGQNAIVCAVLALVLPGRASAQFPPSVTCSFERIATAGLDKTAKITTSAGSSSGDLVLSNLNTDSPVASGNVGAVKLQVLRKSNDTMWLAEMKPNEVASTITLFFKSNVVMFSKQEILHTVDGEAPFGFVEIGKCKPLR